MATTQRPATQEALTEPSGDHPLWKEVPSWFLIGEQDHIIPADLQRYMAERAGARRTTEIPGHIARDHCRYDGITHDFMMLNPLSTTHATRAAVAEAIAVLRDALHT